MKILKNAGKFEVLTKPAEVIHDIALAARTCYQSHSKSTPETDKKLVQNLMKRQHFAMFEFSHINVRFSDVCRGFTHEMVRHRLASFAQESTRYVDESDLHVVVPPHKNELEKCICLNDQPHVEFPDYPIDISLKDWLETNQTVYSQLQIAGWKPEDARQVLPIATRAQIVVGANVREWRHIFKMRCDHFAHWEIRAVMLNLLRWCQANIPIVFDDYKFFTLDDGKEYARPVMHSQNIAERIEENSNVVEIIDKLPVDMQQKLYKHLTDKFWR